jgi:5'-nucleotidase/UDP-sugar diphosphatase
MKPANIGFLFSEPVATFRLAPLSPAFSGNTWRIGKLGNPGTTTTENKNKTMMKLQSYLLIFLALLVFGSPLRAHGGDESKEIVILYVSDMCGGIDGMGKLAALVEEQRKSHKYVFLVTDGNMFIGNPVVDMVKEKGFPMLDLMNRCGFNLTAIANQDFELGQKRLNARMKKAAFPFVSCNMDASQAVLKQPAPFALLKADGIQIPVLGITPLGNDGLPETRTANLRGLKFANGIEKAQSFQMLKKKYGLLIGLAPLSWEEDVALAKAMPEFDLILGGHSVKGESKSMLNDHVLIVKTKPGLKEVGIVSLKVQGRTVVNKAYQVISLDSIKNPDPNVQALVEKYNNTDEMKKAIGIAEAPLEGEHQLGSLMTDAVAKRLHLDFAFQNIGGIRISDLPAGKISMSDIYRLDPYENMVISYKMNPAEIKSLICSTFNREKLLELEVSGMTYTAITDGSGTCTDVEMLDMSGNPLVADKDYTVGVNSYVATSYTFDHRDPGRPTYVPTAHALIEYLEQVKKVNYAGVNRISVKQPEKAQKASAE